MNPLIERTAIYRLPMSVPVHEQSSIARGPPAEGGGEAPIVGNDDLACFASGGRQQTVMPVGAWVHLRLWVHGAKEL